MGAAAGVNQNMSNISWCTWENMVWQAPSKAGMRVPWKVLRKLSCRDFVSAVRSCDASAFSNAPCRPPASKGQT